MVSVEPSLMKLSPVSRPARPFASATARMRRVALIVMGAEYTTPFVALGMEPLVVKRICAPAVALVSVSVNASVNIPPLRENRTGAGGGGESMFSPPGVGWPMKRTKARSPPSKPYEVSSSCAGYGSNSCTTTGPGPMSAR